MATLTLGFWRKCVLETEAYEGELKALRNAFTTLKPFLAEHFSDQYFISGELGPKESDGLPQKILVTPAYGVSFGVIYTKTYDTERLGW